MNEVFQLTDPAYILRNNSEFRSKNAKTVTYGTEPVSFLGPKIWNLVPQEIKASESLNSFKSKIKTWSTTACPCRLCKVYVPQVGFIGRSP